MKKFFALIFLLSFFIGSQAQSPNWEWARGAEGTGIQDVMSSVIDFKGDLYVTGIFSGPVITFGSIALSGSGGYDFFIVKYDSLGNALWAKSAQGSWDDWGAGIAVDASGFIYATGYFDSPKIIFDTDTLHNSGNYDIFLVKYSNSGSVIWAKDAGGIGDDISSSITADTDNTIFITGAFSSDSAIFGSQVLTNSRGLNLFLAKYDSSGNSIWAKKIDGDSDEVGYSVTADAHHNIYVAGTFNDASITVGTNTLINAGSRDIMIVKYDQAGNVLWAKSAGNWGDDVPYAIASDKNGGVYVTGSFIADTVTFGTFNLYNNFLGSFSNVFIAKYDETGNVLWAKSADASISNSNATGWCMAIDPIDKNAVYVTGGFAGDSIQFDSHLIERPRVGGSRDPMFFLTLDSNGIIQCAYALISGGDDFCPIAGDGNGNIYISGDFGTPSIVFGYDTLFLGNVENFFIAKFTCLSTTGITPLSLGEGLGLIIFPNPATNQITISIGEELLGGVATITDMLGRQMLQFKVQSSKFQVETAELSAGIYLLSVTAEGKKAVSKFAVE